MLLKIASFFIEFTKTLVIDTIITVLLRPVKIVNEYIKPYYILG